MFNKLLLIFIVLFIVSCSKPQVVYQTVYKEIAIPVSCDIIIPDRPIINDNETFIIVMNKTLMYIENIESLLRLCKKTNNGVNYEK